jgi:hypothetical protein
MKRSAPLSNTGCHPRRNGYVERVLSRFEFGGAESAKQTFMSAYSPQTVIVLVR